MNRNTIGLYLITFVALIIASFALYYVLTEDDTVVVPAASDTDTIRCDEALDYRKSIIEAGPFFPPGALGEGNASGVPDYDERLADAEQEIDRYC